MAIALYTFYLYTAFMSFPEVYLPFNATYHLEDQIKHILFKAGVPYGPRCLALALLTVPPRATVRPAKLARKLHTSQVVIGRWFKVLRAFGLMSRTLARYPSHEWHSRPKFSPIGGWPTVSPGADPHFSRVGPAP